MLAPHVTHPARPPTHPPAHLPRPPTRAAACTCGAPMCLRILSISFASRAQRRCAPSSSECLCACVLCGGGGGRGARRGAQHTRARPPAHPPHPLTPPPPPPRSVAFQGEEGVDAGGLTREWFAVMSREMFNPQFSLFTPVPEGGTTFQVRLCLPSSPWRVLGGRASPRGAARPFTHTHLPPTHSPTPHTLTHPPAP